MERMLIEAHWGYYPFKLKSGEVAEKGKLACIELSSGLCVKGVTSTGVLPVGVFNETLTGDGTKTISVKLFREIQAIWWANDSGTPIEATDIGSIAYVKDDVTVSGDSTGRVPLGLVLAVDSAKGVLVHSDYPIAP